MNTDLLLERADEPTGYRLETASQAFSRVLAREDQWIALGNFLDDWYRAENDQLPLLIAEPIALGPEADGMARRWATLFVAVIDWFCWINEPRLEPPAWINDRTFELPEPWFVMPGEAMCSWQLVHSPTPFRMRNVFTDESIVSRA